MEVLVKQTDHDIDALTELQHKIEYSLQNQDQEQPSADKTSGVGARDDSMQSADSGYDDATERYVVAPQCSPGMRTVW